jgi:hypothetical protein
MPCSAKALLRSKYCTTSSEQCPSDGQNEAWLAHIAPIPEPSSVALAGLGLAALAGYGWRRRRQQAVGSTQQDAIHRG